MIRSTFQRIATGWKDKVQRGTALTEDGSQRKAGRGGREAGCLDISDSEVTGLCG